jgi:hypothetical protein
MANAPLAGRDDGINKTVSTKPRSEIFFTQRLDSEEIATHDVSLSGKSVAHAPSHEDRVVVSSFETRRLPMLLRMRSKTLIVRSAALPEVASNFIDAYRQLRVESTLKAEIETLLSRAYSARQRSAMSGSYRIINLRRDLT